MLGKRLAKLAFQVLLLSSLGFTAEAGEFEVHGKGVAWMGQGSSSEKVTVRKSDGSTASDKKAKAASLVNSSEAKLEFSYTDGDLMAFAKIWKRSDEYGDQKDIPIGWVKWKISDSFSLKVGNIENNETNMWSWSSGTNSYGPVAEGFAFDGLRARIDDKQGMVVRYHLNEHQSFGIGLYSEDVYYTSDLKELSEGMMNGVVQATGGNAVAQSDLETIQNAATDGKGKAYHLGYAGPVSMSPLVVLSAAYVNSVADKSDGGPTSTSIGQQIGARISLSDTMTLRIDYANSNRKAYQGIVTNWNGKEANTEIDITENALQFRMANIGPGTIIATYGTNVQKIKMWGDDVKAYSETATDMDLVYDISLTDTKKSGLQLAYLTKSIDPHEDGADSYTRQFIGVSLYAKF